MDDSKIFIVGANGQLGTALREQYPKARFADQAELDITDQISVESFDWTNINYILNAAAFTNVDGAETTEGRVAAWNVNASAVANLVRVCRKHDMALLHISSDYVFDGTKEPHLEDEPFSPLGVYGQSKAAGDLVISTLEKRYILRTTWVIGEGKNFVRTMLSLAGRGISPTVVDDQIGRLTFTSELVRAIDHLLTTNAAYGTYNVTNDGPLASWAAITRKIFELAGHTDLTVTNTTTEDYFKGKDSIAPRPLCSNMSLEKLHATGFTSRDWQDDLRAYIDKEKQTAHSTELYNPLQILPTMKTIPTEPRFFTNACESYIYVTFLPASLRSEIVKIQNQLAKEFGRDNFWFPAEGNLHITVAHIISPDGTYEETPKEIYDSVKAHSKSAITLAISKKPPLEITFDSLSVLDKAIIIQGNDNGTLEAIRKSYTDNFILPEGTRRPPTIIHATIGRYVSPLDLDELQKFAKYNLSINNTFQVETIELITEKKIFLQDYEILEQYQLGNM